MMKQEALSVVVEMKVAAGWIRVEVRMMEEGMEGRSSSRISLSSSSTITVSHSKSSSSESKRSILTQSYISLATITPQQEST
jgi:hypothetical protein